MMERVVRLNDLPDDWSGFSHSLEFSPPARGTWNIVHTGMNIPDAHQIYICASACLRGVILTAAEMGLMSRFSTIELRERDLILQDNATIILNGVREILDSLKTLNKLPKMVMIFPVCVHHFLNCDVDFVYRSLRKEFPEIDFAECFMDPIRQTEHMPPEARERLALCQIWQNHPAKKIRENHVNFLGDNVFQSEQNDLLKIFALENVSCHDMAKLASYEEFLSMKESRVNFFNNPFTKAAANFCEKNFDQKFLDVSQPWQEEKIFDIINAVQKILGLSDFRQETKNFLMQKKISAQKKLQQAQKILAETNLAIDYTFTFRPLNLARFLFENNFRVKYIFCDAILPSERDDFLFLKKNFGDEIFFCATKFSDMRFFQQSEIFKEAQAKKILAIGQKAAYFLNVPHFVNAIEAQGTWGFSAIEWLADELINAYQQPKNIERYVRKKALGSPCILCEENF